MRKVRIFKGRFLGHLGLLAMVLCLASCVATRSWRGNYPSAETLAKIQVNKSTKDDVMKLLGAPSHLQMYDGKGWYYIGEETEVASFYKPTVLKRQVLLITFDEKGRVVALDIQDKVGDSEVEISEDQTPTLGRDPAFFKEFFGTIGKHDEGKHKAGMV